MSYGFTLMVSLACFGQATKENELFRDGRVVVQRMTDRDDKGDDSHRNSLFINKVYFGSNILTGDDDDPLRRKPTTYYHRQGPVGFLFRTADPFPGLPYASDAIPPVSLIGAGSTAPWFVLAGAWSEPAIGVVGMHSGTIASYIKPFQTIHFFERNPAIAKLSLPENESKAYFHNIRDAQKRGGQIKVIAGDVRPSIEKAPKGYYKFLFVEMCQRIYLEDVEVEMITKEGLKACIDTLTPDGVVCFHTSNRYLDLDPVLTNSAKSLNLAVRAVNDDGSSRGRFNDQGKGDNDHFSSSWVFVARDAAGLKRLLASPQKGKLKIVAPVDPVYRHVWTDKGPNPLHGMMRDDPVVRHLADAINDPIYKIFPPDIARKIADFVSGVARQLSSASLDQFERRRVSSEWLRKTP